jgi:hypothetical protein
MPRHVIRAEDLPAIQELYAAGATSYQIAEHYHCDPTTIQYWLHKTGYWVLGTGYWVLGTYAPFLKPSGITVCEKTHLLG